MEVIGERSDVKEAHSRQRRQVAAQRDACTSLAASLSGTIWTHLLSPFGGYQLAL